MDYDGFQYFQNNCETTKEVLKRERNTVGLDSTQDNYFREYFEDVIEEGQLIEFGETIPSYYLPNEYFIEWEDGFVAGVIGFWNEVKDNL